MIMVNEYFVHDARFVENFRQPLLLKDCTAIKRYALNQSAINRRQSPCRGLPSKHNLHDSSTICLCDMFCISPDYDVFHDMFVYQSGLGSSRNKSLVSFTICFTICLFIRPDLDGHRAKK
jgi:hypothetical protein